ncbi:MAG TPA: TonB family protein [Kofleriaceae bacterium]|nr:TonB family protein [Kofleriaceae bacterium]
MLGEQLLEGRYRLVRRIATGGMASVYVAEHVRIGRPVAIKVLHPQYADDVDCVRRFLDEGRMVGTLGHPHIVESTDMGHTASGAPFLVLELLAGRTLEQEVQTLGRMSIPRSVRIARQIASALAAAHAKGVIHRDLKSGNVFLLERAEGDHVKVLDFGISKFMEGRRHTQKGKLLGTPWFMAPEQINDPGSVDVRCDVYSLGVIMYEMLAGQVPFSDAPFPTVFTKILYEEPPPLVAFCPTIGPDLAALVARAMAKAPADRWGSMDELGRALDTSAELQWAEVQHRAASEGDFMIRQTPMATPPPMTDAMVRAETGTLMPPRRRSLGWMAGIAALIAAVGVGAWMAASNASGPDGEGEGGEGALAVNEGSAAETAALERSPAPASGPGARTTGGGEAGVGAMAVSRSSDTASRPGGPSGPSGEASGPSGAASGPSGAAAERVDLSIRSTTRGARATFRGEGHRLPLRAHLARADRAELVEISAPGHLSRRVWVTLDRDRSLRVDLDRAERSSGRPPADDADAADEAATTDHVAGQTSATAATDSTGGVAAPSTTTTTSTTATPSAPGESTARRTAAATPPKPGTMDRKATVRAVRQNQEQVQTCFERGRMDNAQLAGNVVMRIGIGPSGAVTSARVARSTLGSRSVETCIAAAVQNWTLPAPAGGVATSIDYTFTFR